ncbi:hypothetical protein LINPERHAP1_LOCUS20582, partial [Linum perenne]
FVLPSVGWPLGSNGCGFLAVTGFPLSEVQAPWSPEYVFMAIFLVFWCRIWILGESSIAEIDRFLVQFRQSLEICRPSRNHVLDLTIWKFLLNRTRDHVAPVLPALPDHLHSEDAPQSSPGCAFGSVSIVPGMPVSPPRYWDINMT